MLNDIMRGCGLVYGGMGYRGWLMPITLFIGIMGTTAPGRGPPAAQPAIAGPRPGAIVLFRSA